MYKVRYMKRLASDRHESGRSKDAPTREIPGRAKRKERLSRSKLKQGFRIDSDVT